MSTTARALGALGVLAASLTAGVLGGGEIQGPAQLLGPASVQGGALLLPKGSQVVLAEGERVDLHLDMGGADLDLVLGPPVQPWAFAHFDSEGMGLFNAEGRALSRGTPQRWEAGVRRTLTLRCRPPLLIEVDGRSLDVANGSDGACRRGPISVKANADLRLEAAEVDGAAVGFKQQRFDPVPAGFVAASLAAVAALLGLGTFGPLLLSPLALLAPRLGLPPEALLWLLAAAATAGAVLEREGWRRGLAALATLGALVGSAAAVLQAQSPMGIEGGDNALVAKALSRTVSLETFLQKVDDAEAYYRPRLEAIPADGRPLVLALGSSSTGGNSHGRFWPEVVGELVPEAHVMRMAWGGMTTWHVRHLLDRLEPEADVCVLYMGHNDLTPTSPGGSLASFEAGDKPQGGFVAPVPLEDAQANLSAIATHCGVLLALDERSMEAQDRQAAFKAMLQAHPDLRYADGSATLEALPDAVGMIDPVHPSPKGHQVLGEFIAEQVRGLLTPGDAPR
ncbi:MAG: SGNH/GDSL hydrolase family protein [Alphaproteobacteria bacterium]|nr:SGNH/GDSL hydrolase family protein [Alphaproteobacteria bacterium]